MKSSAVTITTANDGSPAKPTVEAVEPSEEAFNGVDGKLHILGIAQGL